jgi:type IV secretory pathway VirB2 component (pilin)
MRGYRKFTVALVGIAAGTALAYFGKLDAPAASLIGGIVGGFVAANASQKWAAK